MIKNVLQVTIIMTIILSSILGCKSSNKKVISTYPSVVNIDKLFKWYQLDENEKYLNLKSLRNGVDSFEMRIYILSSLDQTINMYSIVSTKKGLEKKQYISFLNTDSLLFGEMKKYVSDFAAIHKISFKNSDTSFSNLLNKYHLDTLPTQGLIKDLGTSGCIDGASYIIEIAEKDSYRVLSYVNPDCYKNSIQNKIFDNFLTDFYYLISENDKKWYTKNDYLKSLINNKE